MMLKDTVLKQTKDLKKKLTKKDSPLAIQLPEGLKPFGKDILKILESYDPVLFIDPCYGACDIKDDLAKNLKFKTLIHFGHYPIEKKFAVRSIFVPIDYYLDKEDIDYVVKKIIEISKKNNYKKVTIVTTIQYLKNLEPIRKKLEKEKLKVTECKKTNRVEKGMILGCDCSTITDKTAPIFFIGDGVFHANNIAYVFFEQKIYTISPLNRDSKEIAISLAFIKRRYGVISRTLLQNSQNFAILVSTKYGQNRLKLAKEIAKKLKKNGKNAQILISDYIYESYFLGMGFDCYINTGCPRLTYDDYIRFDKPLLSPPEVDLLFDINKKLEIDQIKQ